MSIARAIPAAVRALRWAFATTALAAGFAAPAAPLVLGAAEGEVPVTAVRALVDREGRLGIAEVRASAGDPGWQAIDTTRRAANFGLTSATVWFALDVRAGPGGEGRWLLALEMPSLDRAEVWVGDKAVAPRVGGDLLPFSARAVAHRHHLFPLELGPGEARTIHVRLQSEGSLTAPFAFHRAESLAASDHRAYAALGLYFGILLALLLYNVLMYVSLRDGIYLLYVLFVGSMGLAQAAHTGLANEFLWGEAPRWGHQAIIVGMAFTGIFAGLFVRRFLAMASHSRGLDRAILVTVGLFAFALATTLAWSYAAAAYVINVAALSFALLAVAGGARSAWLRQPGARYFLLAWSFLLVGTGLMAAINVGIVPSNFVTRNALIIGSGAEMLLLSFALAARVHRLRADRETAATEALAAKQSLVVSLQDSERRLEARVSERTRDLEELNARLVDREHALERLAHHDVLTGLANRRRLDEAFSQAAARSRRTRYPFALLLVDLDGFKSLRDRRGRAFGDRLLVTVAGRLREVARDADHLARLGGDEFVVLAENLASIEEAGLIATTIQRALEPPIAGDGEPVRVSASIGIAGFPVHGGTADEMLDAADTAMIAAKRGGGVGWRIAGAEGAYCENTSMIPTPVPPPTPVTIAV